MSESLDKKSGEGIIAWFARNHVAANLLMVVILVGGAFTIPMVKKEVFPTMTPNVITVSVPYLGAAPEEVEESICRRIEEEVQGLSGIEKITSVASEGMGIVRIEVLAGEDTRLVMDDVKSRVDSINTFPEEAEKPIVADAKITRQVINVAVTGNADSYSLKALGVRVRDDILALPNITKAELYSAKPYEISIEVSEDQLMRHRLTFDDVATAVRRSSLDLPGGSIKAETGEILLRAKGQAYVGKDFEEITLLTRRDGTRVRLGDVATVVDGFADSDIESRFDGKPSVIVKVFRVGDQSVFDISESVYAYLERASADMPDGIELVPWRDDSEILVSRLDLLIRSAAQGLILVFLVLALFLRFKLAVWVTIGIPISFLGAIALMPAGDVSVNMISLFAFIVVLGIVVDDAIVVGENIYKHIQDGEVGETAAIEGAKEVAVPVTFAVLTTVAAFSPMFFVAGNAREIWRTIPFVVVACLLFSLVESKLILPAHLSSLKRRSPHPHFLARLWGMIQMPFIKSLDWFIHKIYSPTLDLALRFRYATIAIGLSTLMICGGLVAGGYLKFVFFPIVEGDNIVALLKMPRGTPVDVTVRAVGQLEDAALRLQEELEGEGHEGVIRHFLATVGEQPYVNEQRSNQGAASSGDDGAHLGEVNVQLAPGEKREISAEDILARWRVLAGEIPGVQELSFTSSLFTTGEDINIQLSSPDIKELDIASEKLKRHLATIPGVEDITDNFEEGKDEVKLRIKPSAELLGLTLENLGRQVRQAFYGEEVQRVQRGRDEIKVMVRYPVGSRRSLGDLEEMRVRTPNGDEVPFSEVAEFDYGQGYATIRRTDRARTINVIAEVDEREANPNEINESLASGYVKTLMSEHPTLRYSLEGDQREQAETLGSLFRGFGIALFAIFALMAIPFRSYLQPLIVMTAIPFGIVGAILGHVIMGMELSLMSMFGLVALSGVVVNDSLVLVDFVNRSREKGKSIREAARQGGVARFRPILMTSLTTFAGLTPLLVEQSVQAKFLVPMAVSLGFGVMLSTVVTLVLVPCLYLILDDTRRLGAPIKRGLLWLYASPESVAQKNIQGS